MTVDSMVYGALTMDFTDNDIRRFREKYIPVPESGCWLWTASGTQTGYGQMRIRGKSYLASRISYEMHIGPIPHGLTIDHLCRVRCCVNPAHLEAVTFKVNVLRGNAVSAIAARKTHCVHGHPFDERTYVGRNGARVCRPCLLRRTAAYYRRKKNENASA
jgi:hypothetical protein